MELAQVIATITNVALLAGDLRLPANAHVVQLFPDELHPAQMIVVIEDAVLPAEYDGRFVTIEYSRFGGHSSYIPQDAYMINYRDARTNEMLFHRFLGDT